MEGALAQDRRRKLLKDIRKCWQLYLILLLPIAWLFIFKYIPMLGLQIAFKRYSPVGGIWGSRLVGFTNFVRFFTNPKFGQLLWNTFSLNALQLFFSFPVPIVLALLINASTKRQMAKVVQTMIYLPHFISTVVIIGLMMQLLNPITGLNGAICRLLGLEASNIIAKPGWFKPLYVGSHIWQNSGWGTVIYLATLASVDPSLHEAARVDGAGRFKRILYIDFPTILPTAVILLIMETGRVMNVGFEKVFLMQNPLNLSASEVISTYVYKVGLSAGGDFSYSTSVGLFNSVINIVLISIVNVIAKRTSETSLW